MDSPIWFDTITLGRSIVYIKIQGEVVTGCKFQVILYFFLLKCLHVSNIIKVLMRSTVTGDQRVASSKPHFRQSHYAVSRKIYLNMTEKL